MASPLCGFTLVSKRCVWSREAVLLCGLEAGALSLLGEGIGSVVGQGCLFLTRPCLGAAFESVSACMAHTGARFVEAGACLAAIPRSSNSLGPEGSWVAAVSCGVAALACGDAEQQQG